MINLLPKENRLSLKISYYNNLLLRLIFISFLTFFIISGISLFGSLILSNEESSLEKQLESNSEKFSDLKSIEKESKNVSMKIKQADFIFKDQKHYSNFLIELSQSLPLDVDINFIAISPDMTSNPASVIIHTKKYENILEAKQKLEQSKLIDSVDIKTVSNKIKEQEKTTSMLLKFNQEEVNKVLKW